MELNFSIRYDFKIIDENEISFTTDNGVEYLVYFDRRIQSLFEIDYSSISKLIVEFGFIPVSHTISEIKKIPFDRRIMPTVVYILRKYFEKNENAIIYNCLTTDDKQKVRSRLFSTIFNSVGEIGILKFDTIIETEKANFYQSLLIQSENQKLELIKTAFYNVSKYLAD